MRRINIMFLLFLFSCSSFIHSEYKENFQSVMSENEFFKLKKNGKSLEDLNNYKDFCLKTDYFFCHQKNTLYFIYSNFKDDELTKDYNSSDFTVEAERYFSNEKYFNNFSKNDGQQCIVQYYNIKSYRLQLIRELEKKVDLQNKTRTAEVNRNIENLEKFIEQEYLKSFHEKISISLKNNFGIYNFKPEQWNFNNHYIRVTTDGNNVNVIKDDKLIFSSNINKYKPVDFNTTGNIYMAGKKKIDNLVETYKKNNISKDLQEKCKHYLPL